MNVILHFVALLLKCGDTVLPEVVVARRLKVFLEDDIDRLFPRDRWVRALAHPTRLPAKAAPRGGGQGTYEIQAGAEDVARSEETWRGESDHSETTPVAGVRFSQIQPPEGKTRSAFLVLLLGSSCGVESKMGEDREALHETEAAEPVRDTMCLDPTNTLVQYTQPNRSRVKKQGPSAIRSQTTVSHHKRAAIDGRTRNATFEMGKFRQLAVWVRQLQNVVR